MAVKTAYVMVDDIKMIATYNETTKLWTAEGNAPANSSWGQEDHVYRAEIHAEDDAGNSTVMTADDETYGEQLKFRVLEKTKPTATIVSPTAGSVLGSAAQDIVLKLKDTGGSGLNMSSVVFKLNGTKITTGLTWTDDTDGGKKCTYKATGLPDGSNKIELQVTDNDGNVSVNATTTFIISTAAPTLNVTSPAEGLVTNSTKVTVAGTAAAGSASVTLQSVTIDGVEVAVGSGGAFSKEMTYAHGAHEVVIEATDSLGKKTTVRRNIKVDTKAPVISDVVAEALTVDTNGRIRITFKVVDPE